MIFDSPKAENGGRALRVSSIVAPDLNYGTLEEVANGQAAQRAYLEIINPETPEERRGNLKKELLDYCKLDTFAMVRLAKFFEET